MGPEVTIKISTPERTGSPPAPVASELGQSLGATTGSLSLTNLPVPEQTQAMAGAAALETALTAGLPVPSMIEAQMKAAETMEDLPTPETLSQFEVRALGAAPIPTSPVQVSGEAGAIPRPEPLSELKTAEIPTPEEKPEGKNKG